MSTSENLQIRDFLNKVKDHINALEKARMEITENPIGDNFLRELTIFATTSQAITDSLRSKIESYVATLEP